MTLARFKFTVLIILSLFFVGCGPNNSSAAHLESYKKKNLRLSSEDSFLVYLAETPEKRTLGLSRIKSTDFDAHKGMLFSYPQPRELVFWMPETYFDLDVFFLDENLVIQDVHRDLKHYPHKASSGDVPRSKKAVAQYVLEVKSGSVFANKLQKGMKVSAIDYLPDTKKPTTNE